MKFKTTIEESYSVYYDKNKKIVKIFDDNRLDSEFRDISKIEFDSLYKGVEMNKKSFKEINSKRIYGTGYKHVNSFKKKNWKNEIGGEVDQAWDEIHSPYFGMTDDEAYEADLLKTYPELKTGYKDEKYDYEK